MLVVHQQHQNVSENSPPIEKKQFVSCLYVKGRRNLFGLFPKLAIYLGSEHEAQKTEE